MHKPTLILIPFLPLILLGCGLLSDAASLPTPTEAFPVSTATQPPKPTLYLGPPPTVEQAPTEVSTVPNQDIPRPTDTIPTESTIEEAILILEPGPGSRLLSQIHVAGLADPTFEQHLLARVVLDDGTELAAIPTTIQSDVGIRGPFAVDIPFTIVGERQAFIQVSTSSPRDGGTTHLASVIVTLADSGIQEMFPVDPHPERIIILAPGAGEEISGGVVQVSGYGLASFEQTLVVDVIDGEGNVVGSQPLIVESPEMGQPGPFSVSVPYTISTPGPGRIVVRDPSVAIPGDVHLTSVDVDLNP